MITPTLNTHALTLRQLRQATADQVEWLSTADIVKYSEQRHVRHTLKSEQRYIEQFDGERGHIWAIEEVTTGDHVGNITAHIDVPNRTAELGILIGDMGVWGEGYGTEAWRAVADWLLMETGGNLRKIECGCHANNVAMRRVFDHAGFIMEGERKLHFLWFGQPVGLVYYGKFR